MSSLYTPGMRILVICLIFAMIIIGSVIAAKSCFFLYTTTGISMEPMFHEGDRFLLYKATYDSTHAPEHGDLIVFKNHRSGEPATIFKRVIGIPGDTVQVSGRDISINVIPVRREPIGSKNAYNELKETLPDGTDSISKKTKTVARLYRRAGFFISQPGMYLPWEIIAITPMTAEAAVDTSLIKTLSGKKFFSIKLEII